MISAFLASPRDIEDEDDIVGGELDIVLMDVSVDKEWAQIDFLFSHEAYIRVEEVPFLYNVRLSKKVDKSLLGDFFSSLYHNSPPFDLECFLPFEEL